MVKDQQDSKRKPAAWATFPISSKGSFKAITIIAWVKHFPHFKKRNLQETIKHLSVYLPKKREKSNK